MVFVGFFGNADAGSHERGGFVLLDAATGALIKKTYVISTPSSTGLRGRGHLVDGGDRHRTGFAYVGTSNPHDPHNEHPRSDSILKVDLTARA